MEKEPFKQSKVGRPCIFDTPEEMEVEIQAYYKWIEENPFYERKVFCSEGQIVEADLPKMRPLTIEGLALFLGMTYQSWLNYCQKPEFFEVTTRACEKIANDQFAGAASGFLNANIIARKLGLADKQETTLLTEQPLFGGDNE